MSAEALINMARPLHGGGYVVAGSRGGDSRSGSLQRMGRRCGHWARDMEKWCEEIFMRWVR